MNLAMERLRAIARTATAPGTLLEQRILELTGLPVVFRAAPDRLSAGVEARLQPMREADDFAGLAIAFDRLFARRTFGGNGYRTYRIAENMLLTPVDEAISMGEPSAAGEALDRYRRWWLQDRANPIAAAILARALLTTGEALDAHRFDSGVCDDEFLRDACGEARGVLARAGPNGRRHWLWRQADFTLAFCAWSCGAEDEELLAVTFEALQKLDPHEFGIYDDRTEHLLPEWAGSVAAIDVFARAAAARTAGRFGELMYARIYDRALRFIDADQTGVDQDRLLRGFADWHARFPTQAVANRYAAHAHAFGADAIVRGLFRDTLQEIQPAHWFDADQPLEAWYAICSLGKRLGI